MLAGVLGYPVAHSRSPAMHNAAFEALGMAPDWRYFALPVPGELFDETVRALPGSGYRGANVTIPHKLLALAIASDATEAARGAGAANTLTFDDGQIHADNTDVGGLLDAVGEAPASALVLGAGGAARGVIWGLRQAGTDVAVWNRTPERATALAAELDVRAVQIVEPGAYEAVLNTTAVGLDESLSDESALAALCLEGRDSPPLVIDLVYRGRGAATPLQHWAEQHQARFVDGLEILVRQGARSFEIWTGQKPPLDVMRRAAMS